MSATELLDAIRAVVGARGLLTDPADTAAYTEDWRRLYQGRTPAVIRPADTAELAEVVRLCAAARAPLVPQGGNARCRRQPARAQPGAAEPGARDRPD
jgi:FAD/FMN-containing dehydrogenase